MPNSYLTSPLTFNKTGFNPAGHIFHSGGGNDET